MGEARTPEYQRRLRDKLRAKGLCISCCRKPIARHRSKNQCVECLDKHYARQVAYRAARGGKRRPPKRRGYCVQCRRERICKFSKVRCLKCMRKNAERSRKYRERRRNDNDGRVSAGDGR